MPSETHGIDPMFPTCYICGGNGTFVGNETADPDPDAEIFDGYTCIELEEMALGGFLPPGQCQDVQDLTNLTENCECFNGTVVVSNNAIRLLDSDVESNDRRSGRKLQIDCLTEEEIKSYDGACSQFYFEDPRFREEGYFDVACQLENQLIDSDGALVTVVDVEAYARSSDEEKQFQDLAL